MKHCYHMVIFDVNAEDETKGITGPPPVFLEASVLENVSNLLYPDGKIAIILRLAAGVLCKQNFQK